MLQDHPVESVWDYPRPPRLERTSSILRVVHRGVTLAETRAGFRVLETSHPPVYYIPRADVAMESMKPSSRRSSFCEFKGVAGYWNLDISATTSEPGAVVHDVAWSYADPSAAFVPLANHLAFYASKVDECSVDGEIVQAQPGDFYGGWITSWIKGPFKGAPGTMGW